MGKKKKLPKQLAILDEDLCTGCDACVAVCPVDCIDKSSDPTHPGYAMGICTIDLGVCIGCKLCAMVCPWDVITMVPTDQVLQEPKFAQLLADWQSENNPPTSFPPLSAPTTATTSRQ